jgi:NAD(P)H-dependent flavin oxidoreductase YrpB (nitropropane dioxygenase family)
VGKPASYRGRIEGDTVMGVLPVGQSAGLIQSVESAGNIVRATAEEAARVLGRLASLVPKTET